MTPQPRRRGVPRRTILSLAGLTALAGCAKVPTSGPVVRVNNPRAEAGRRGIDVDPQPPADGASIDLIVGGFLQAMASARDDYRVARAYLTRDVADKWDPHAGATVYDAASHKPRSTVNTASLEAPVIGVIDAEGRYRPVVSQSLQHDFGMAQEGGQWRISNPPEGLLISQYTYARAWVTLSLYFVVSGTTRLVPDLVHLPTDRATPDAALRRLLAGTPPSLGSAVTTAVPDGVGLQSSVSVDAVGVVTVPLTSSAAQMPDAARRRLASQVAWTLESFPTVSRVRFTAGGETLPIPESAEDNTVSAELYSDSIPIPQTVSPSVVVVMKGAIGRVDDRAQAVRLMDGALGLTATGTTGVASVAVAVPSTSGGRGTPTTWYAVSADRRRLLAWAEGSDQMRTLATGSALLRPQVLVDGTVVTFTGTTMVAVDARSRPIPTRATSLEPGVTAFSVSPDGVRIALVVGTQERNQLLIGRLTRQDGRLTVSGLTRMPLVSSDVNLSMISDVVWLSQTTTCVLGRASRTAVTAPYEVLLDGSGVTSMGPLTGSPMVSVAAVPNSSQAEVVTLSEDGRVMRYEDQFRWRQILTGASAVSMTS